MLKRLKITKYRQVRPGTELEFSDGFNLLLGKNGTGKTTLLELVSMIVRADLSMLRHEEFDFEFDLREDSWDCQISVRRLSASKLLIVTASLYANFVDAKDPVRVELAGGILRWARGDSPLIRAEEAVDIFQPQLLTEMLRPALSTMIGWPAFWHADHGTTRFDETLRMFDVLMSAGDDFQIAKGWFGTDEVAFFTSGPTLLPENYEVERPMATEPTTHVRFPETAALARFAQLTGFRELLAFLSVGTSEIEGGATYWMFEDLRFIVLDFRGTLNATKLSFGQKRLLSFLYYVDLNPHVVIADELANGMHHEWIQACMEAITGRQAFLTSQNPLLFDYIPFASAEDVRKSLIQCRTENGEMIWQNLSAEDADQFFRDYEVGVRFVGEILRARGLW